MAVNQILISSHTSFGLTIAQILQYNPIDVAIGLIIAKLGFGNKLVIGLILAFLL
jgi:hypothetical protein